MSKFIAVAATEAGTDHTLYLNSELVEGFRAVDPTDGAPDGAVSLIQMGDAGYAVRNSVQELRNMFDPQT